MQLLYGLYKLQHRNPLTPPYVEAQDGASCLGHAFKMALGKKLLQAMQSSYMHKT